MNDVFEKNPVMGSRPGRPKWGWAFHFLTAVMWLGYAGCLEAASTLTVSEVERSGTTQGSFLVQLGTTEEPTALELELVFDPDEVEVSAPGSLQIPGGDAEAFEVAAHEKSDGRMRVVLSSPKLLPLKDGTSFRVPVRATRNQTAFTNTLPVMVSDMKLSDARAQGSQARVGTTVRIKGVNRDQVLRGGSRGEKPQVVLDVGLIKETALSVASVEYFVNGTRVLQRQNGAGAVWEPPGSGTFELKARVTLSDDSVVWSGAVPVVITGVNTPPVRASYSGLVRDRGAGKEAVATGAISFATTAVGALGSYSMKLNLNGRSVSASGKMKPGSTDLVSAGGVNIYFQQEAVVASDQIRGVVSNGTISSEGVVTGGTFVGVFEARRNVWIKGRVETGTLAGRYTVALPSESALATVSGAVAPEGVGTVSLSALGVAQGVFSFWDGSRVTLGGWISKDGVLPVYGSLKKGVGFLAGEMDFSGKGRPGELGGSLNWRSSASDVEELAARGGKFVPAQNGLILPVRTGPGNLVLGFSGGGLEEPVSDALTLGSSNAIAFPSPNVRRLSLKIDKVSGMVAGGYQFAGDRSSSTFLGVVLPVELRSEIEAGYFTRVQGVGAGRVILGGTVRLEVAP